MKENFYIVIMAGGAGTRLWPMSRTAAPKQLQKFISDKSLLEETYERTKDLVPPQNIFVSLVKNLLKPCQEQLRDIPKENFIVEPVSKNTAPAMGLVACNIFRHNPRAIVATIASDHTVGNVKSFQKAILKSLEFINYNPKYFSTITIKPTRPDTGFGYIKIGKKFKNSSLYKVEKFVEKPNLKTAEKYLKSGKYYWNASYFTWRADKLLGMFKKYNKEIFDGLRQILKNLSLNKSQANIEKIYKDFPNIPIDTAIAEKTKLIATLPTDDFDWSDIGSWSSLYDLLACKTKEHTVCRGNHLGVDNKNCLIYARDKLLATVGLEDIVIVDTPDVTLVCNKNKSQDIKKLIENLKVKGKNKYL